MDDKDNYRQLVVNLVRCAIDLSLQNDFYKRQLGEIGHFRELPETMKKLREFQPPVNTLEKATTDKEAASALQDIIASLARFHE
jgi:hypothetical protein